MSGSSYLGLQIFTQKQKTISDVDIRYVATELDRLKDEADKLGDKQSEYDEICDALADNDKKDTVQYRLAKSQSNAIQDQLDDIADEEEDWNFLKEQAESISEAYSAENKSFGEEAKKEIQSSFNFLK